MEIEMPHLRLNPSYCNLIDVQVPVCNRSCTHGWQELYLTNLSSVPQLRRRCCDVKSWTSQISFKSEMFFGFDGFLAVQNSSTGDLATEWLSEWVGDLLILEHNTNHWSELMTSHCSEQDIWNKFWQFCTNLTILDNSDHFDNFGQFGQFWTILDNFGNFDNSWQSLLPDN